MCMGSQPKPPKIEYVGPSSADIRRGQDSLDRYQREMQQQQSQFQTQLQGQIDAANAETAALQADFADETAELESGYAAEAAASAAASAADQAAAYTTSAQQTEIPEGAQTTAAVVEKKKPKKSLKISTAGTANSAGSGLNIGV